MNDTYIPVEKMLYASKGSIYKLAILAAKRAMMLADGERALIEKPGEKVLDNALQEILSGAIRVVT